MLARHTTTLRRTELCDISSNEHGFDVRSPAVQWNQTSADTRCGVTCPKFTLISRSGLGSPMDKWLVASRDRRHCCSPGSCSWRKRAYVHNCAGRHGIYTPSSRGSHFVCPGIGQICMPYLHSNGSVSICGDPLRSTFRGTLSGVYSACAVRRGPVLPTFLPLVRSGLAINMGAEK